MAAGCGCRSCGGRWSRRAPTTSLPSGRFRRNWSRWPRRRSPDTLHEEDANALHERYENRLRALIAGEDRRRRVAGAGRRRSQASWRQAPRRRQCCSRRKRKPRRTPPPDRDEAAEESEAEADAPVAAELLPREIGTEILLRIIDIGDRSFDGPGWAGMPGGGRRIEAISIRPRDELAADAVEFRVFAAEGRATPWVGNGSYAGTSGRELALTGFAARPVPGDRRPLRCRVRGLVRRGRRRRADAQRRDLPLAGARRSARGAARQPDRAAARYPGGTGSRAAAVTP